MVVDRILSVTFNTMTDLDDNDIAILRGSLESWKEECKDAGDKWQFAAIDRIMEQKKVPIEDLIPEELIEEIGVVWRSISGYDILSLVFTAKLLLLLSTLITN